MSEEPASKKLKRSVDMQKVAVIRSEGGSFQKYQTLLVANNIEPLLIPSIEFEYKNVSELAEALNHPENFSGIIFTSTRSVNAVKRALSDEALKEEWKSKQIYCVGQSTWTEAKNNLGVDAVGQDSGSASKLSEIVIKDYDGKCETKPLLFPCSSIKSDTLPESLSSKGIVLKTIDVYDTKAHPLLEENLSKIISSSNIRYLVFFSPSGVNAFNDIIQKKAWDLKDKKIVAIGETTTKALLENGFVCHGTAKNPSAEGLLECLLSLMNS